MKYTQNIFFSQNKTNVRPKYSASGERGIALVLVLACLVIITVLTVAFLQSVRTDLQSSQGYVTGANARMLAESTLNVVIGQIQEATQRPNEAWVSQPGLIRTYNTSGTAVKAYKLYSSDALVVDGVFNPLDGSGNPVDVPSDWKTQGPSMYTDLNDPILKNNVPRYPILNPDAIGPVEGFNAPTETLLDASGNPIPNPAGGNYQKINMPVKWIYVLRDGTRATAAQGTSGAVKLTSIDPARPVSRDNPPVARIAFWTDDESNKININTASEGTYYDTPIANTYKRGIGMKEFIPMPASYVPDPETEMYDLDLAWFQAANKEYQRYPGHPATTCLSPLLYNYINLALGGSATRVQILEEIYKLTPKYPNSKGTTTATTGTSRSGTLRADVKTSPPSPAADVGKPVTPIGPKTERLYSSIDELLYSPVFNGVTSTRTENPINTVGNRRDLLDSIQFFATAHSKSPEVTLFNSPRVAIWPLSSVEANRTPLDKLMAFCSELPDSADPTNVSKNIPYFFQRNDPLSMTNDWQISKNGKNVNQEIYKYLQNVTSRPIPGFGGSFSSKWGPDRDQILTQIVDYTRSTNLFDRTNTPTATPFIVTTSSPSNTDSRFGIVLPLEPGAGTPGAGTRGFGRYFTISEMALAAVARKPGGDPNAFPLSNDRYIQFALLPEFFSPAVGNPSLAYAMRVEFKNLDNLKLGGQSLFQSATHTIRSSNAHTVRGLGGQDGSTNGGCMGYGWYVKKGSWKSPQTGGEPSDVTGRTPDQIFPIGELLINKDTTGTISGTVNVEVWYDPPSGGSPVLTQAGAFNFDGAKFNAPTWTPHPSMYASTGNLTNARYYPAGQSPNGSAKFHDWTALSKKRTDPDDTNAWFNGSGVYGWSDYKPVDSTGANIQSGGVDVVLEDGWADWIVSVVPNMATVASDYRLLAATHSGVDLGTKFQIHPWNGVATPTSDTGARRAHSLHGGWIWDNQYIPTGTKIGVFTPGLVLDRSKANFLYEHPDVVRPLNAADDTGVRNSLGKTGDWVNSVGQFPDGAMIDRPSEGEAPTGAAQIPYFGHDYSVKDDNVTKEQATTFFSPNRLMPSPVVLGSLPTGVKRGLPWQTLLFRPNKSYFPGEGTHPGAVSPPDHLLLDLFWMPVVEPYAISERFSTAGKINLNYQIAPFTNIKRTTGLRAVLKPVMVTALNPSELIAPENGGGSARFSVRYKSPNSGTDTKGAGVLIRHPIDMDATLAFFEDRFRNNRPFISASEICDIPLVPKPKAGAIVPTGTTSITTIETALATFWNSPVSPAPPAVPTTIPRISLTGDNSIERPYAITYPRVTSKSNTYQVHIRVQTLAVSTASATAGEFRSSDKTEGEFRGSFIIERYLDPTKQTYELSGTAALGPYKVRVVNSKQLAL
jgi:uncharacterized protein (TIGR02600 family)